MVRSDEGDRMGSCGVQVAGGAGLTKQKAILPRPCHEARNISSVSQLGLRIVYCRLET